MSRGASKILPGLGSSELSGLVSKVSPMHYVMLQCYAFYHRAFVQGMLYRTAYPLFSSSSSFAHSLHVLLMYTSGLMKLRIKSHLDTVA